MPDPALQAYLASKYLSGPKADAILARVGGDEGHKKKKKKRKRDDDSSAAGSGTGLRLVDDDEERRAARNDGDEDDMADAQVVEGSKQSKFSRSAFSQVSGIVQLDREEEDPPAPDELPQIAGGSEELIAAAAASASSRRAPSKSQQQQQPTEEDDLQFQTVYRDASGRKIDLRAEEEARKAAEAEKRRKDEERKTWGMGVKQKQDQARARERLREEATTSFARDANDKRMNDTLRAMERSDDPALSFLTKKRTPASSAPAKPKYKGPAPPPNRFGIAPGYRWDGVDRSTGFERMYFQKINERKRRDASALAYDQDDL
ncbi:Pre-mRNA-splicing factor cwc26 [Tilletia horrida]|nr:Pre-mRNA-splicing factor cwc26 [Tilletia horrida]